MIAKMIAVLPAMGSLIERPKTDSGSPPSFPTQKPKCGSYCIKASVDMVNDKNQAVYTFEGYNDTLDIADRVNQVCDRWLQNKTNHVCANSRMAFLGEMEVCDGTVFVKNAKKELVSIV